MRTDTAQPIRLKDYSQPDWWVDTVHLDVAVQDERLARRALALTTAVHQVDALPEGGVESAVTVTGGILVALAHAANLRLRHGCGAP